MALAGFTVKLGMEVIDLSLLEQAEPRLVTQQAGFSRYGHSIENWAIFED